MVNGKRQDLTPSLHPPSLHLSDDRAYKRLLEENSTDPRQRDLLLGSFQFLRRLEITITPVDHLEVIVLAESTGLTIDDGSYL